MANEILKCSTCDGTWARVRTRGRKPQNCPSCREVTGTAVSAAKKNSTTDEGLTYPQSENSAQELTVAHPKGSDAALDILTSGVWLDNEFERKLTYVLNCLDDPKWLTRRETGDVTTMLNNQQRLLREFKLYWPRQAAQIGVA